MRVLTSFRVTEVPSEYFDQLLASLDDTSTISEPRACGEDDERQPRLLSSLTLSPPFTSEPLVEGHDVRRFDCGKPELDNWLRTNASCSRHGTARTRLG